MTGREKAERGRKSVDWKASPESVLEAVQEQLWAFGLRVDLIDTGTDEIEWEIVRNTVVSRSGSQGVKGRTPYDGKPYYCKFCGMGWGEYIACEEGPCELESEREALLRLPLKRKE